MQPDYPARFTRDTGGTEAEWLGRLVGACKGQPIEIGAHRATIAIDDGALVLHWRPLPPRRIALMSMPRLEVEFDFENLSDEARTRFMRYFDLYMQRGGG